MAKDAKGHGSEKRGGQARGVPKIAWDVGGKVITSPGSKLTHELTGAARNMIARYDAPNAAAQLAQGGGPKATVAPIHGGASGPSGRDPANSSEERARIYGQRLREDIKAFTDKYGGPRDHAAEQRAFNRGKREINRLKRQGK